MPISKQQKAVIHVAKSQLHMADEDYRALLLRVAGVRSSSDLEEPGFEALMAELERLGFRLIKSRVQPGRREGMATPAQVGKIFALWKDFSGKKDDLEMGRWLEKYFHVSHVRFLDDRRASKAIVALEKMAEWRAQKARAIASPETQPVNRTTR